MEYENTAIPAAFSCYREVLILVLMEYENTKENSFVDSVTSVS